MSLTSPDARERWYDLDAARSVLMMLGVVLHAANVYAAPQDWLVGDPPGRRAFAWLSGGIHVFRIPAFFVVAGFFAGYSLERYGPREFLARRARRLLVPLASAALVLGTLQSWVLHRHGTAGYGPPGGGDLSFAAFLGSADFARTLREGLWVTHLWFLVNLAVYVLATWAAAACRPLGNAAVRATDGVARRLGTTARSGLFLLALPLANVAVPAVAKYTPRAYDRVFGVASLHELLAYLPYYAFGLFAFRARAFFEALRTPAAWTLPALAAAGYGFFVIPHTPSSFALAVAGTYLHGLAVWLSIAVVLAVFEKLASRPSRTFAYLSEASYTVYLFHHLAVVALGLALVGTDLPAWSKFGTVVVTAAVGTLVFHHFAVLRVPLLRYAFNGKWR